MEIKEKRIKNVDNNDYATNTDATLVFKQQLGEREVKNRKGEVTFVFPAIPKSTTTITINVVLNGILDLSILQKEGYDRVKEIRFKNAVEGVQKSRGTNTGLIEIINIPDTIEILKCNGNRLKRLSPLSRNLKELEVENNEFTDIDLTRTPNLKKLNISFNDFQELKYLPASLKYLNCSHNNIRILDLNGVSELTDLFINDNKIISILNIPTLSLKHISYYNNPLKEIEELNTIANLAIYDEKGKVFNNLPKQINAVPNIVDNEEYFDTNNTSSEEILNYKEAIIQYFKMKKEYENNIKSKIAKIKNKTKDNKRKQRLLMASLKGNCIVCKRNVGTIFKKNNNNYIAICGDVGKNPCRLNIKIYNGISYNFFDDMHYFKEYTEKSIEEIIKQKMDVLFNYITDKKASVMFESELKKYTDFNSGYTILLDKYKEIYENPAKKELIRLKRERIYAILEEIVERLNEYKKNPLNRDLLKDAMEIQQRDLIQEIEALRKVKYEQMTVICDSVEKEGNEGLTMAPKCSLLQNEYKIDTFVYSIEEPKVIRFDI